jgi:hypothetical protein
MINVFDREHFLSNMEAIYEDPLTAESEWLCHLNLVFAIGLTMATPKPGTEEAEIIAKLKEHHEDRAEAFYLSAKTLSYPLTGFEDADFWSIQALLLMTVYMLARSRRNTAFALLGMAVRSGYALGLHREDSTSAAIFGEMEQSARRNVWRSLFIMDRFLALSLGRTPAIYEDELYVGSASRNSISVEIAEHSTATATANGRAPTYQDHASDAMDAAGKACALIGYTLRGMYQQRKTGTRLAQELAQKCKEWPNTIAPILKWPSPTSYPYSSHALSILHVNLLFIHSVILVTRPFFIYFLNHELSRLANPDRPAPPRRGHRKIAKFSEACVSAATHTATLANGCYKAGVLSQRNPFVIYFLSSAALVLLANDFAELHNHPAAEKSISEAFTIMGYCAEADEQAERLLYIMETFREAVQLQKARRVRDNGQVNQLAPIMGPPTTGSQDLSGRAFGSHTPTPFPPPFSSGPAANPFGQSSMGAFANSSPVPSAGGFMGNRKSTSSTPTPMEPLPPPSAPPNPLSPSPNRTPIPMVGPSSMQYDNVSSAFTSLLDFSSFNTNDMSMPDDGSGGEENFDFDIFWNWSNNAHGNNGSMGMAPGAGPPTIASMGPLYGVMDG